MRAVATFITGFGDAALLLPAAAALLVYLLRARSWQAAAAWVGALGLCAGLTVAAKMMFHACGGQFPALDIHSPSGHTSLSATFYGCGALMLAAGQSSSRRFGTLLASAVLVVAIAVSRVLLHAHTLDEAAAGLAIGLLCLAIYAATFRPRALGALDWRLPVGVVVVLALLTHNRHLSLEGVLDRMADHFQLAQYVCPLTQDAAVIPDTLPRF